MMKMNRAKFLKTELGSELWETVKAIDFYLSERAKTSEWKDPEKFAKLGKDIDILMAKWEIFKMAIKQFYGIEYNLTRTDEYFGICTEDESDFLIKERR